MPKLLVIKSSICGVVNGGTGCISKADQKSGTGAKKFFDVIFNQS